MQANASTDSGNVENELFLILYFDPYCADGQVHVRDKLFTVRQLRSGTTHGLFDILKDAIKYMGVTNWENKMIGFGCHGCSANMGGRGLRGLLTQSLPWVVVFWCVAHLLELALNDVLKATFFTTIAGLQINARPLARKG